MIKHFSTIQVNNKNKTKSLKTSNQLLIFRLGNLFFLKKSNITTNNNLPLHMFAVVGIMTELFEF